MYNPCSCLKLNRTKNTRLLNHTTLFHSPESYDCTKVYNDLQLLPRLLRRDQRPFKDPACRSLLGLVSLTIREQREILHCISLLRDRTICLFSSSNERVLAALTAVGVCDLQRHHPVTRASNTWRCEIKPICRSSERDCCRILFSILCFDLGRRGSIHEILVC
jgi:hypothetical protein